MFRVFLTGLFFHISVYAEIQLPSIFSDGMVLQQGQEVPVWGQASEGSKVSVSFAGRALNTKAGKDGSWMIKLSPLKASASGAKMLIKIDGKSKTVSDILVGEVWLCSGQSNMDFNLGSFGRPARSKEYQPIADYVSKEIKTANDPLLRQIEVMHQVSPFKEQTSFKGTWKKCSPRTNSGFTGTGYFFARELRKKLGVPVGLIKCAWSGTRIEPWIPATKFKQDPKLKIYYEKELQKVKTAQSKYDAVAVNAAYEKQMAEWKAAAEKARAAKKKPPVRPGRKRSPQDSPMVPSTLYQGMIKTIIPYAFKGVIWYQGESNTGFMPTQYEKHFSLLIQGWREAWGQGNFPFYWCQLAQFKEPPVNPVDKNRWADISNQQRLTMKLENTGMAVLNDIGEANDIHPRNKVDAGKRLSLWALAKTYNVKVPAYSGPLYESHKITGSKVMITFTHNGSGLMCGKKILLEKTRETQEPLKFFQICGKDRVWKWATAEITGKNTVEVFHKDISNPIEVRYAWASNANGANLYNKEGLPASLFKTE